MEMNKFALPARFSGAVLSVWNEFNALDCMYKAVNLGQGKPNFMPAAYICQELNNVANTADPYLQQKVHGRGLPRLKNILSRLYEREYKRKLSADKEILITCGAYEALYDAIIGFVDKNDEVIIIEPFFDCYEPMTRVAGGQARFVPLRKIGKGSSSADWKLDEDQLRSIFNSKTKMIVLNNPMNPIGKVFSREELNLIADLCIQHDVICVSDEVYEWLTYDPLVKHTKIASLPGMWERTITIGSAGKALWVTGWKCGWAVGPEFLINRMNLLHEHNTQHYVTPIQEAVARCLEREYSDLHSPNSWLQESNQMACRKRDYFVQLLKDAGFDPIVPEGGFFILADWSNLGKKLDLSSEDSPQKDFKLAKWMIKNIGLSSIPTTAFYSDTNKHIGENLIRFCFIKTDETLEAAAECLQRLKGIQLNGITEPKCNGTLLITKNISRKRSI